VAVNDDNWLVASVSTKVAPIKAEVASVSTKVAPIKEKFTPIVQRWCCNQRAYMGLNHIPSDWGENVELSESILKIVDDLLIKHQITKEWWYRYPGY